MDVEATQTVDIINFVNLDEVNPLLFYKPYYMEVEKGGDKAYVLLRQALADSGKIAIAKLVIKTRQHLAAIKPQEAGLMLELMRFPEELLGLSEFKQPQKRNVAKPEMSMAMKLVESMSDKWRPEMLKDDYHEKLEQIVQQKVERGGKAAPPAEKRRQPANVVDLVSVLQQSIKNARHKSRATGSRAAAKGEKTARHRRRHRPAGKNRLAA